MKKKQAEEKYGVPCFTSWAKVPNTMFTRSSLKEKGIDIPKDTKPDAIKSNTINPRKQVYFLFNIEKYK